MFLFHVICWTGFLVIPLTTLNNKNTLSVKKKTERKKTKLRINFPILLKRGLNKKEGSYLYHNTTKKDYFQQKLAQVTTATQAK